MVDVDFCEAREFREPFVLLPQLHDSLLDELLADVYTYKDIEKDDRRWREYWESTEYLIKAEVRKRELREGAPEG